MASDKIPQEPEATNKVSVNDDSSVRLSVTHQATNEDSINVDDPSVRLLEEHQGNGCEAAIDGASNSATITQSNQENGKKIFRAPKSRVKCFVWFVQIIIFLSVLTCLVLSKITFMKIVTDLYILSNYDNVSDYQLPYPSQQHAASLYWMIFFIIMVPNSITWIRGLFNGLLSRSVLRPWPKQYSWRVSLLHFICYCLLCIRMNYMSTLPTT